MSDAPRPGLGFLVRGLLCGAAAGAFTGLLDATRAIASPNDLVQPADAFSVVLFYAGWFAPLGVVAALVARWFDWPHRMLNLLLALGCGLFFVGAWLNVAALPGFTSPLALFVDLVLVVVAFGILVVRYRADGDDAPQSSRWAILGIVSGGIAFCMPLVMEGRGDGPRPEVAAENPARRPNVLLVLVDTLRADHLSCYGYGKPTSPELDRFAADATLFSDCRSVTSWTKPSIASLFTSMYPSVHACKEQREVLVPDAETLAEVFRAAGWRTAAFVDNPFVSAEFGFGQGFERYDSVHPSVVVNGTLLGKALFMTRVMSLAGKPFGVGDREDRGAKVLHDGLLEFTAEMKASKEPWFAYVHAMEPHLPYVPSREDAEAMGFPKGAAYAEPPRYNGILPFQTTPKPDFELLTRLVAQYDGEIRGWSREFGKLVEELARRGDLESTIVVVVADHGEEFCEHGGWTHGHSLHREVTQVPCIVRLPDSLGDTAKASRGRKVGGVATLLDIFPTLVELAGIRHPRAAEPGRSGRSLLPELTGGSAAGANPRDAVPERPILGEVTMTPVGLRSIRDKGVMLIRADEPMQSARSLYIDATDPKHARDRFLDEGTLAADLEARMDDLFRRLASVALTGGTREIDPETAEMLRKIGYLGGK